MTKKEIITALKKADIKHNPKAPKSILESLLPPPEPVPPVTEKDTVKCRQKGCPDAHDNDGFCSVCGHPLTE